MKFIINASPIIFLAKIEIIKDGEPYLNKLVESGYRISEGLLQQALLLMRKR